MKNDFTETTNESKTKTDRMYADFALTDVCKKVSTLL
jgi:hypothetical protein